MKLSIFKRAMLPACLLFSLSAQAELVSADWLNNGDSLSTIDTVSGLTWLDLTVTQGQSYDSVVARLTTDLSDWRLATAAEVYALIDNIYPTITWDGNGEATELGALASTDFVNKFSAITHAKGFYDNNGTLRLSGAEVWNGDGLLYRHYFGDYNVFHTNGTPTVGTYLVGNSNVVENVNAPFSAAMLGLGLLGFSAFRRQQKS
jgi:hypothetical protein